MRSGIRVVDVPTERRRLAELRRLRDKVDEEVAALERDLERVGAPAPPPRARPVPDPALPPAAGVRAWAQRNGLRVAGRGRLSPELRGLYAPRVGLPIPCYQATGDDCAGWCPLRLGETSCHVAHPPQGPP